jgi:hypothetical protein
VPAACLADGQEADPAVTEQSFERSSGVQHGYRYFVPVAREASRQNSELPLAAADGQIANEEEHLHLRFGPCSFGLLADRPRTHIRNAPERSVNP